MEKRIFKNTPVTQEELSTVAIADLLEAFNARLVADGAQPIAKFADKKSAIRRTWACLVVAETPVESKTIEQIENDLDDKVAQAQAKFAPPVLGNPVERDANPATDPMVFCDKCGRSVPKSSVFTLPCSTGGTKSYCKKEEGCKKSKKSTISLKEQAQAITAQVAIKKAPKAKATPKGPNPNIGKFDNCLLSAKENKRANSESIRSAVYNHIASNQGCTIKDMEKDGVALLPVLRDCVKKLFADLKIEISGWEVVTPRTLNFREVK